MCVEGGQAKRFEEFKPQSVIRYDSNRLLHNNTILHSVIFLMTVIRKMIIRKYPIDGLKGQKQIAYGNAVGLGNIRYRPEGAKAQSLLMLLPFQGDRSASHLPKALLRDVALARQRKRAFFVLAMRNVALGYYLVAPLGRFVELWIII